MLEPLADLWTNVLALAVQPIALAGWAVPLWALLAGVALVLAALRRRRPAERDLGRIAERLATIDAAQGQIQHIAGRMADLDRVLSDRGARGAFGEARMEAILRDALPAGLVTFQATLSNGRRPDALVRIARGQPALAIDAKFPLEAWRAFNEAGDARTSRAALARFRTDVTRHAADIAARYRLPGETQPQALMFVPSEAVFADIHAHLPDVLARARGQGVAIVSPTLLLLAVQTMAHLAHGHRVAAHARAIEAELARLSGDLAVLLDAVATLRTAQANGARALATLDAAASRLAERGGRLDRLELGDDTDGVRGVMRRAG